MAKQSGGILLYRRDPDLSVYLVHPGGPLFARKDAGAWSVPKGEIEAGEEPLTRAIQEFFEEVGYVLPAAQEFRSLGSVRQKGGKVVHAFTSRAPSEFIPTSPPHSMTFTIEWPPRSGRQQEFPEVDRGEFFTIMDAREKINPAQLPFLDRLLELVGN